MDGLRLPMFEKQNNGSSFSYITFWNKNMMVGSYMLARLKDGNKAEHGEITRLKKMAFSEIFQS